MGRAVIPVDLHNPGQVFACMGFLEAAEILCGPAAGGFGWDEDERFVIEAEGAENPIEAVLKFLSEARVSRLAPNGWVDPPKKRPTKRASEEEETEDDLDSFEIAEGFPAKNGDKMALPIRLAGDNKPIVQLSHWADGSSRNSFKLYAGNRSAAKIATDMLGLIRALFHSQRERLLHSPFAVLCRMGGSFNLDPRGAWTAIDAGYSPDKHKAKGGNVFASPVVQMMAAWGMEHTRPDEYEVRQVRYAVWQSLLPAMLARAAFAGGVATIIRSRRFRFSLSLSGKNKVICFAQEDPTK